MSSRPYNANFTSAIRARHGGANVDGSRTYLSVRSVAVRRRIYPELTRKCCRNAGGIPRSWFPDQIVGIDRRLDQVVNRSGRLINSAIAGFKNGARRVTVDDQGRIIEGLLL
jgi:hypothetical protein